ncbi:Protein of unknown function [Halobacillus dabanensis]|uniref:DUF3231 family protein n=1 Tax=Halobacillus dabanensis TaxID=240302 RepID=A0A1I3UEV9_HALDA|nr:DUF3231 family protein [Halobacillus dabanensis]SFJ80307.1 Protein of unknown function [Halobacillus dabanensis]
MQGEHKPRLTSSEFSIVWNSYQQNSFSICMLKYFLANVDDQDVKSVLEFALFISERNFDISRELLQEDNQPIPVGFTEEDVCESAPRLYSDTFYLYYLKNMAKVGLSVYGVALAASAKSEVRDFLSQAIQTSTELYNKTTNVLLSKGIFIRAPFVSTTDTIDFIDKKNYLGGFFSNRPINIIEITHIQANNETNMIGNVLLKGFAQVAKDKKVRAYCIRGAEIAKKHVEVFQSMLTKEDIQPPAASDLEVTDSTKSPFTDKLIMYQTSLLISSSISNYATASAASLRTDIATSYVRLTTENAQYAKDGVEIMIKNEWLEQPPQVTNHKGLTKG